MNGTAAEIEACFRTMLGRLGYQGVTVSGVCECMGISRKTFYTYYHDKEAIVERVFNHDVMKPSDDLLRILGFSRLQQLQPNVHERQFKALCDDGLFYRDLVGFRGGGESVFSSLARDDFYRFNRKVLATVGYSKDERRCDYVADYFAMAKAELLLKWIRNGFDLTPAQLAKVYDQIALPFWTSL